MTKLLLLCIFVLSLSLKQSASSNWWSPYKWRHYWEDWWEKLEEVGQSEGIPLGQQKPERVPNADGPNVCTNKIPVGIFRKCRKIPGKRRLQCRTEQHFLTEYRCCPGYARVNKSPGCPKELYTSDKNIVEVAESLSLSEFANLMKISGLVSELQGTGERYTAFVPSNQAFSSLKPETLQELKSNKEILRETLLLHIASGKIVTEVMKDNQEITALDGSHLRINVADEGQTIIVQGGEIVVANEGASNGIIHIIDRVLSPASDDIGDILKSNPNFSIFSQMIENAAMNFTNITLFAPTDKAFEVMDRERLETLLSNEECVGKFIKYHLLPKPIYSAALDSKRYTTAEGHFLDVRIKGEKEILVNDASVTDVDISGNNGVIHVIGKVLMPVSAMNLLEVTKVLNLSTLVEYLNSTGFSDTLREDKGPFTLFAPTNKAFQALPESTKQELRDDPEKLKQLLAYHLVHERKWTYEFGKDNMVNTVSEGKKLRLNSFRYGKVHSVDGACVTKANIEACNGVIHVINKVLLPPSKTIYELINSDSRFVTLAEAINTTALAPVLQNPAASLTLFAPTDWAFAKLELKSPGSMETLLAFPEELTEVLKHHVVNGTLYTCGIHCKFSYWSFFSNQFSVFSMARGVLRIRYAWNGRVYVNSMRIIDLDLPATNGVVHVIDDVLELYPHEFRKWKRGVYSHRASRGKKHRHH